MRTWTRSSWKHFPQLQQPEYPNAELLNSALNELKQLPPLVFPGEILNLKYQLGEASKGKRFILQGGDCAERFIDCSETAILEKMGSHHPR